MCHRIEAVAPAEAGASRGVGPLPAAPASAGATGRLVRRQWGGRRGV